MSNLGRQLHRFVPLAARLPDRLLRWLDHHVPLSRDPACFNWSFWTDASYYRDMRREGHVR